MLFHRCFELHRLEEVVGSGASEDRHAVGRGPELLGDPALDPLDVPIVALPVGAVGLEGAAAGRQLSAEESVYVVLAVLIRLGVQVQAEDGKGRGRKVDQAVEFLLQQRRHRAPLG
jgi:hypothetical protein